MSGKPPAQTGANYVYKIVPHSSVNPRHTFPVPIPASHTFVLSELDAKDGYLHMSTASQLAGTLNRFFKGDSKVVLLKMDYKRLSGWKVVKWEASGSGEIFPHLYAQLEGENVESHKDLAKNDGETSWDAALERARQEGCVRAPAIPDAGLPDDVVLLIIDACDHLEKDRGKTLAALCRLAKRYKEGAEHVLYSRVELRTHREPQPVTPGTPLYTLVHVPRLRPNVKSVTLEISDEHARLPPVVDLLQDLNNIEELSLPDRLWRASDIVLAQENLRIRTVHIQELQVYAPLMLKRYSAAFSSLTRVALGTIPIDASTAPPSFAGVTSLAIESLADPKAFVTFTSAFASHFTCLRLPMTRQLQGYSLAIFPNLKHLSLFTRVTAQGLVGAIPHAASLLDTAGSLRSFVSLGIEGVLVVRENTPDGPRYTEEVACDFGDENLAEIPALSTRLLQAIPPQVQHLSFVTFLFRADDVATYVLGPSRPPALRTLRLGGAVGQGFKELGRSRSAWYADFERTMEEAGVELTTVG
ncbi:hypothetical protein JCM10449v2_006313 [Rhodotorula kratochvilovae]